MAPAWDALSSRGRSVGFAVVLAMKLTASDRWLQEGSKPLRQRRPTSDFLSVPTSGLACSPGVPPISVEAWLSTSTINGTFRYLSACCIRQRFTGHRRAALQRALRRQRRPNTIVIRRRVKDLIQYGGGRGRKIRTWMGCPAMRRREPCFRGIWIKQLGLDARA